MKWIAPSLNETKFVDIPGNYTYQTTFTLPAYDYISVAIPVSFYVDDYIYEIMLNGVILFTDIDGSAGSILTEVTLQSSFASHFVLTIIVRNNQGQGNNPTGLQWQFGPPVYNTLIPSMTPTSDPSSQPSFSITSSPTVLPTSPTVIPTSIPTSSPTIVPSVGPTAKPSVSPTCAVSLCQQGQYSQSSSSGACMPCPNGQYASFRDQTSCSPCPVGKYSSVDSPGATSACFLCPAGKYTSRSIGASTCVSCPSGKYADSGATICTPCPQGQYSPFTGYSGCLSCWPGTSSSSGASACVSCPANTASIKFMFNCSLH